MCPPTRVGEIVEPASARTVPISHMDVDAREIAVVMNRGDETGTSHPYPIPTAPRSPDLRVESKKPVEVYGTQAGLPQLSAQRGELLQCDVCAFPGVLRLTLPFIGFDIDCENDVPLRQPSS